MSWHGLRKREPRIRPRAPSPTATSTTSSSSSSSVYPASRHSSVYTASSSSATSSASSGRQPSVSSCQRSPTLPSFMQSTTSSNSRVAARPMLSRPRRSPSATSSSYRTPTLPSFIQDTAEAVVPPTSFSRPAPAAPASTTSTASSIIIRRPAQRAPSSQGSSAHLPLTFSSRSTSPASAVYPPAPPPSSVTSSSGSSSTASGTCSLPMLRRPRRDSLEPPRPFYAPEPGPYVPEPYNPKRYQDEEMFYDTCHYGCPIACPIHEPATASSIDVSESATPELDLVPVAPIEHSPDVTPIYDTCHYGCPLACPFHLPATASSVDVVVPEPEPEPEPEPVPVQKLWVSYAPPLHVRLAPGQTRLKITRTQPPPERREPVPMVQQPVTPAPRKYFNTRLVRRLPATPTASTESATSCSGTQSAVSVPTENIFGTGPVIAPRAWPRMLGGLRLSRPGRTASTFSTDSKAYSSGSRPASSIEDNVDPEPIIASHAPISETESVSSCESLQSLPAAEENTREQRYNARFTLYPCQLLDSSTMQWMMKEPFVRYAYSRMAGVGMIPRDVRERVECELDDIENFCPSIGEPLITPEYLDEWFPSWVHAFVEGCEYSYTIRQTERFMQLIDHHSMFSRKWYTRIHLLGRQVAHFRARKARLQEIWATLEPSVSGDFGFEEVIPEESVLEESPLEKSVQEEPFLEESPVEAYPLEECVSEGSSWENNLLDNYLLEESLPEESDLDVSVVEYSLPEELVQEEPYPDNFTDVTSETESIDWAFLEESVELTEIRHDPSIDGWPYVKKPESWASWLWERVNNAVNTLAKPVTMAFSYAPSISWSSAFSTRST